jgi:hypothetical protein|tara:strand:+ start:297 stop:683 length:387 start_codon:yes stop_codon:yes gene_type:complete
MQTDNKFGVERRGKEIDKEQLADLEKIEFDVMQNLADTIKRDFEKETKDKPMTFLDWLKSKDDDYFKRIELSGGGKVIKFSDYKDPIKKIKNIDLASLFTPSKTLASLTEAEKEVVNDLLRRTLGKDK